MKLTDIAIRKAVPDPAKAIQLRDELGLYLEISPAGLRSWRIRDRTKGAEKRITIGHYPDMSLVAARKARDLARNPAAFVPVFVPAPFREVATDWYNTNKDRWAPKHAATVLSSLNKEVFPLIGDKDVRAIAAPDIKALLRGIEARGIMDVAHDVRQRLEAIFRFAKSSGLIENNPAADMRDVIKVLPPAKSRAAVVTLDEARQCLAAGEAIPAFPVTRLALRFLALTAQRPGEVRKACWPEFEGLDGPAPIWRIPADHMKMGKEHLVPLSPAAVDVLRQLFRLTGKLPVAFPSSMDALKPMSENAIGYLLNRAGYAGRMVPHGWRSSFSTIMNGRRPADRAVIDLMLAHEPKDKVEAAYNRQMHWATRISIANEWTEILLTGRPSAEELIDMPRRSSGAMALVKAP